MFRPCGEPACQMTTQIVQSGQGAAASPSSHLPAEEMDSSGDTSAPWPFTVEWRQVAPGGMSSRKIIPWPSCCRAAGFWPPWAEYLDTVVGMQGVIQPGAAAEAGKAKAFLFDGGNERGCRLVSGLCGALRFPPFHVQNLTGKFPRRCLLPRHARHIRHTRHPLQRGPLQKLSNRAARSNAVLGALQMVLICPALVPILNDEFHGKRLCHIVSGHTTRVRAIPCSMLSHQSPSLRSVSRPPARRHRPASWRSCRTQG